MENSGQLLKKFKNIELQYDPAIPYKVVESRVVKKYIYICAPVFVAALFIITKRRKQPKCPLTEE